MARGGLARAVGGGGKFEIVYGFLSSLEVGDVNVERVPVYIRQFLRLQKSGRWLSGIGGDFQIRRSGRLRQQYLFTGSRCRNRVSPDRLKLPRDHDVQSGPFEIPLRTTSSGFHNRRTPTRGNRATAKLHYRHRREDHCRFGKTGGAGRYGRLSTENNAMRVFGAAGVSDDVKRLFLPSVTLGTLMRENISSGGARSGIAERNGRFHAKRNSRRQISCVTFVVLRFPRGVHSA